MQDSLLDPASLPFGFFAAFFGVYGMAAAFGTAVACSNPHFLSIRHRYPGRNTSTADRCRIDVGCTSPLVLTAYRAPLCLSRAGLQQGALLDLVLVGLACPQNESPPWELDAPFGLAASLFAGLWLRCRPDCQNSERKNWGRMNSSRGGERVRREE